MHFISALVRSRFQLQPAVPVHIVNVMLLVALALCMTACQRALQAFKAGSSSKPSAGNLASIDVSPDGTSVKTGARLQLTAIVHNSPNSAVIWRASAGTISSQGLFEAPKVSSAQTITVTAENLPAIGTRTAIENPPATGSATVTVEPATLKNNMQITTSRLPDSTAVKSYNATLAASGGQPPYRWSISLGSLPSGLLLNAGTGLISGSTLQTGTFSFTAQALHSSSTKVGQALSPQVAPAPSGGAV